MFRMSKPPRTKRPLIQVSEPLYNDGSQCVGEYTMFRNLTTQRLYMRVSYIQEPERYDWYLLS